MVFQCIEFYCSVDFVMFIVDVFCYDGCPIVQIKIHVERIFVYFWIVDVVLGDQIVYLSEWKILFFVL